MDLRNPYVPPSHLQTGLFLNLWNRCMKLNFNLKATRPSQRVQSQLSKSTDSKHALWGLWSRAGRMEGRECLVLAYVPLFVFRFWSILTVDVVSSSIMAYLSHSRSCSAKSSPVCRLSRCRRTKVCRRIGIGRLVKPSMPCGMHPFFLASLSLFVCAILMLVLFGHRSEGYLVLSGGLTVHTFRDWSAWNEETAAPPYVAFHKALVQAIQISEVRLLPSSH